VAITAEQVNELRKKTGAGIMDCKRALEASEGDLERALVHLRKEGMARADARMSRPTAEGVIASYVHAGGRIGVLVELNCETDFVARTEEFQALARELAMQVAAEDPKYLSPERVPPEVLEKEREIYRAQALKEGKPEKVVERIVEGKLEKFYQQVCLMEQPFIRDDKKTIAQLVKEHIAKLGENILVRRFCRFQLGEE
jgi:elongation factor Ts